MYWSLPPNLDQKTRPISSKWWVFSKGNPGKFQGNLGPIGWWNILIWPDACTKLPQASFRWWRSRPLDGWCKQFQPNLESHQNCQQKKNAQKIYQQPSLKPTSPRNIICDPKRNFIFQPIHSQGRPLPLALSLNREGKDDHSPSSVSHFYARSIIGRREVGTRDYLEVQDT